MTMSSYLVNGSVNCKSEESYGAGVAASSEPGELATAYGGYYVPGPADYTFNNTARERLFPVDNYYYNYQNYYNRPNMHTPIYNPMGSFTEPPADCKPDPDTGAAVPASHSSVIACSHQSTRSAPIGKANVALQRRDGDEPRNSRQQAATVGLQQPVIYSWMTKLHTGNNSGTFRCVTS